MQVRGRMQEGMVTDIGVFDPGAEAVTEEKSIAPGMLTESGVRRGARPGPRRGPGEDPPRRQRGRGRYRGGWKRREVDPPARVMAVGVP